ncbi:hypothetical protein EDD21DRAFT_40654 [Dissophora ornata]|nr:hypothetical protein EDD21DRAFT_40654 [Dissophora ornata]
MHSFHSCVFSFCPRSTVQDSDIMTSRSKETSDRTLTTTTPADPSASSTTPSTALEAWDDLDTNVHPQMKVEPMSPFSGSSLTLDLSPPQMHSEIQTEAPSSLPPSQSFSVPMHLAQSQDHAQAPSQLQLQSSSLTMTPSSASSSKTLMYNAQLPPMPPSLSIPHSQQHSSRSTLQTSLQSHNALSSALPGLTQHHQYGLAHLSDLMTGGLMVSKPPVTTHTGPSSNRPPPPPSLLNHTMFHSGGSSLVSMQQSPQPMSSSSNQDPFSYDQSTAPFYSTQQDQQQQQRHAAFLMTRGPSSSSTCSNSSSSTFNHDHLNSGVGMPMMASGSAMAVASMTATDSNQVSTGAAIEKVRYLKLGPLFFRFYSSLFALVMQNAIHGSQLKSWAGDPD